MRQAGRVTDAARPLLHFHRKHFDAIVSGEKATTVRWGESVQVGAATFVFDDHPTAPPLAGLVTAVRRYRFDELTAERAHQPAGTDMTRFAEQLRENYYPDMPDDAVVDVAELVLTEPSRRPPAQRARAVLPRATRRRSVVRPPGGRGDAVPVQVIRLSRQAVSLSEDVEDHSLEWSLPADTSLGEVLIRAVDERYLPRMTGSAWTFWLLPPEGSERSSAAIAVCLHRAWGRRIVTLGARQLSQPLAGLTEWLDEDGALSVHVGYDATGGPRSVRRLARELRRHVR